MSAAAQTRVADEPPATDGEVPTKAPRRPTRGSKSRSELGNTLFRISDRLTGVAAAGLVAVAMLPLGGTARQPVQTHAAASSEALAAQYLAGRDPRRAPVVVARRVVTVPVEVPRSTAKTAASGRAAGGTVAGDVAAKATPSDAQTAGAQAGPDAQPGTQAGPQPGAQSPDPGSPVADALPTQWPEAEIAAARAACTALLAGSGAVTQPEASVRLGVCGAAAPVRLSALAEGAVTLKPPAVINCTVAAMLATWVEEHVQPAALATLGTAVTGIVGSSSYECRNRNRAKTGPISEHAFANAIDILGFTLADGRTVSVLRHWGPLAADAADEPAKPQVRVEPKTEAQEMAAGAATKDKAAAPKGQPTTRDRPIGAKAAEPGPDPPLAAEARFLRLVHADACGPFRTVLGPQANTAHRDHLHLDMKTRRGKAHCE